jgi:hypothetical protein
VGLTDPAARQALVDRLNDLNTAYTNAKLTDEYRRSLLSNDARAQYAGKLNKAVDGLTDAERADADALAASVAGGAAPASTTSSTTTGTTAPTAAAPWVPLSPLYLLAPRHHLFSNKY